MGRNGREKTTSTQFSRVVGTQWLVTDRIICSCTKPLSYQTTESRQPSARSQTLQYCNSVLFREFETGVTFLVSVFPSIVHFKAQRSRGEAFKGLKMLLFYDITL